MVLIRRCEHAGGLLNCIAAGSHDDKAAPFLYDDNGGQLEKKSLASDEWEWPTQTDSRAHVLVSLIITKPRGSSIPPNKLEAKRPSAIYHIYYYVVNQQAFCAVSWMESINNVISPWPAFYHS